MSLYGLGLRASFKISDTIRDRGLQAPKDIVRFDNLPYGTDPRWQTLDVYRPKNAGGTALPVIVSVHGGGWVYGDKNLYQYYCMSLAQHGFADGGFIRNPAVLGIGLGGADDFVNLVLLGPHLPNADFGADVHHFGVQLAFIQHVDVFQLALDFRDAALDDGLLVFGLVILAVFGEIAERKRYLDFLRNLFPFDGLQIFQFFFQPPESLVGDNRLFCHIAVSLSVSAFRQSRIAVIYAPLTIFMQ